MARFPRNTNQQELNARESTPEQVKRGYQAAIKFVHPDKMADRPLEEQMLAGEVFQTLTRAYNKYKRNLEKQQQQQRQ